MAVKNDNGYPFDYQELGPEETEELKNYFTPIFTKTLRLGSKGYFFYNEFDTTLIDIYNMELRSSDTFVVTFPRSGTTWTQELVWLLQNDCDFEKAKATALPIRFPFIESGAFLKLNMLELPQQHDFEKFIAENFVVYVARDPRDVVVSNFYHMKSGFLVKEGTVFKEYWNLFLQNKVLWSPYFEHVKEAWSQRNHPNMAFFFYEELSENLPAVAYRLATFFGKHYSEEQFQAICDHLKFDNFKNNRSVNMKEWISSGNFIRQGKSGGWREHFDAEMTQQAESWIADNLRDTDLRFPEGQ